MTIMTSKVANKAVAEKTIEAAIFTLAGGGDVYTFLAPAIAIEWCMGVTPGEQKVPPEIQAALIPFLCEADPKHGRDEVDTNVDLDITSGSADNDAAMFLCGVCRDFDSQREAVAFAKEKGWTIVEEEYEGCSY